jgi:hypothetical protein
MQPWTDLTPTQRDEWIAVNVFGECVHDWASVPYTEDGVIKCRGCGLYLGDDPWFQDERTSKPYSTDAGCDYRVLEWARVNLPADVFRCFSGYLSRFCSDGLMIYPSRYQPGYYCRAIYEMARTGAWVPKKVRE